MKRLQTAALLVFLLLLGRPGSCRGQSDASKDLGKFLAQHGYGALATDNGGANRQAIQCQINGRTMELQIDTGCGQTCITSDCARSLKLVVYDSGHKDWGVGGILKIDTGRAVLSSFKIKGYEINRTNVVDVLPPSARVGECDGLFGFDFLKYNAAILPVGSHLFLFKPGNAPVPALDSYMRALGLRQVPLHHRAGGLFVDGQLNGHPCVALVDCGAEYSTVDFDYILKVQGGRILAERMFTQGVDGQQKTAYGFLPNHFELGTLTLDKTELTATKSPTFSHEGFNALFGYDLLAAHQAIIDLGHDALWMK